MSFECWVTAQVLQQLLLVGHGKTGFREFLKAVCSCGSLFYDLWSRQGAFHLCKGAWHHCSEHQGAQQHCSEGQLSPVQEWLRRGRRGMDSCSLCTDSFARHYPSALELTTALGQSRCPAGTLIGPQKMEGRNWTCSSPGGASSSWCSLWWVSSLLHLHKWH